MKKYQSYKPSGVEWIGEIPEHWKKCRLKNVSKSINGYSFKSDDFDREYDIPVIRIGDVGDKIDELKKIIQLQQNSLAGGNQSVG
jgi:type I restriction enzyme S subunit